MAICVITPKWLKIIHLKVNLNSNNIVLKSGEDLMPIDTKYDQIRENPPSTHTTARHTSHHQTIAVHI